MLHRYVEAILRSICGFFWSWVVLSSNVNFSVSVAVFFPVGFVQYTNFITSSRFVTRHEYTLYRTLNSSSVTALNPFSPSHLFPISSSTYPLGSRPTYLFSL